jgi:hypothetical protein
MVTPSFIVGDRVQARTSGFVPEGTHGTIQEVLCFVPTMYYVQFDGYGHPTLMHLRDLAQADEPPPPEQQRSAGAG